ncbi:MAG TPA: serine hydrolase [Pyrinomonadaceae bacterium]|nr:serine hydrolase [Pyrinomonadaceae bacterium]
MSSKAISEFLQSRVDAGDFPSAVYLVAERGEIRFHDAVGHAVVEPEVIDARPDTIYDLASLTKPLVTALIVSRLVESGDLDPNSPLGDLVNEFYTSTSAEITVNELMMHTSGMPAWKPLYLLADDPDRVAEELARTLPRGEQEPVTYSDLNYITLGLIAEELKANDLSTIFTEAVVEPLGLVDTAFNPSRALRHRIAASEKGNRFEKNTCIEQGYLTADGADLTTSGGEIAISAFRDQTIWGEVHDGNAYFLGGVAGHAGLFSTAPEVLRIAQQFLPTCSRLFTPETCALFMTNFTPGMNEDRSFGFQLASTEGSTAGTKMSPESFGHNGFTGTSLWIDPLKERVFVLLTNRMHNHGLPFVNINSVRRRFHDLAIELLDENK